MRPPNDNVVADIEAATSTADAASASCSAAAVDAPLHIHFRALEEEDVPALRELQSALFPVQYPESFYTRLFTPGYFCQVGVLPDGLIITVASARVVDYRHEQQAEASSNGDGRKQRSAVQSSREAYLMTFGVREGYRRHRLGVRAMEQILQLLIKQTSAEYVALHVKSANRAAVHFYESQGWSCDPIDGYLPNHYYIDGRQWDAYRYTRSLRSPMAVLLRDVASACAIL